MTEETKSNQLSRRRFLRGSGSAAGAAGIVAAMAVTGRPAKSADDSTRHKVGYRETEHVRKAYRLARF